MHWKRSSEGTELLRIEARLRSFRPSRRGQTARLLVGGSLKRCKFRLFEDGLNDCATMEKMRQWLAKRRFKLEVRKGAEDSVDFSNRLVEIDARRPYQVRLSSLIHECGHVKIFFSRLRNPAARVCGCTLKEQCLSVGRREQRARSSRISTLHEELEAWESGMALAKTLSVRYNKRVVEKDRVKALMTYVLFTAQRMRMKKAERALIGSKAKRTRSFPRRFHGS